MRLFIKIILLCFLSNVLKSQTLPVRPSGLPSPKSNGYTELGWNRPDSGTLLGIRDTSFQPPSDGLNRKLGSTIYWQGQYWFRDTIFNRWQTLVYQSTFLDSLSNLNLQRVTTRGNVTDNAIWITGYNKFTPINDGLLLAYTPGGGFIQSSKADASLGVLQVSGSPLSLDATSSGGYLTLSSNTTISMHGNGVVDLGSFGDSTKIIAGTFATFRRGPDDAYINVRGARGMTVNDFITKAQLDSLASTTPSISSLDKQIIFNKSSTLGGTNNLIYDDGVTIPNNYTLSVGTSAPTNIATLVLGGSKPSIMGRTNAKLRFITNEYSAVAIDSINARPGIVFDPDGSPNRLYRATTNQLLSDARLKTTSSGSSITDVALGFDNSTLTNPAGLNHANGNLNFVIAGTNVGNMDSSGDWTMTRNLNIRGTLATIDATTSTASGYSISTSGTQRASFNLIQGANNVFNNGAVNDIAIRANGATNKIGLGVGTTNATAWVDANGITVGPTPATNVNVKFIVTNGGAKFGPVRASSSSLNPAILLQDGNNASNISFSGQMLDFGSPTTIQSNLYGGISFPTKDSIRRFVSTTQDILGLDTTNGNRVIRIPIASIVPAAATLQSVTTGANNNLTSNAIGITNSNNSPTITTATLLMRMVAGLAYISSANASSFLPLYINAGPIYIDASSNALSLSGKSIDVSAGSDGMSIRSTYNIIVQTDTPTTFVNSSGDYQRIKIARATNADDAVTKAQLDSLGSASATTPTLQQVATAGNSTNTDVIINTTGSSRNGFTVKNSSTMTVGTFGTLSNGGSLSLSQSSGGNTITMAGSNGSASFSGLVTINNNNTLYGTFAPSATWKDTIPGKDGTFAMISDVLVNYLSTLTSNGTIAPTAPESKQKVDATSGAITVTITTTGLKIGQKVNVKKIDATANNVIIQGSSGNIDGSATLTITTQYINRALLWNGTNFDVL